MLRIIVSIFIYFILHKTIVQSEVTRHKVADIWDMSMLSCFGSSLVCYCPCTDLVKPKNYYLKRLKSLVDSQLLF